MSFVDYAASYSARDIVYLGAYEASFGAIGGPVPKDPTETWGGALGAATGRFIAGTFRGLQGSFVGLGFYVDMPGGGGGGIWPFLD